MEGFGFDYWFAVFGVGGFYLLVLLSVLGFIDD